MKRILALLVISTLSTGVFAGAIEDEIDARLTPAGKICVEGEECEGATTVATAAGADRSGEEVYNAACMACHTTGAAGAPMIGDIAAWAPRFDKGLEALYASAINGIGVMPAKGGCMSCSDGEISAAVDYIASNTQ